MSLYSAIGAGSLILHRFEEFLFLWAKQHNFIGIPLTIPE